MVTTYDTIGQPKTGAWNINVRSLVLSKEQCEEVGNPDYQARFPRFCIRLLHLTELFSVAFVSFFLILLLLKFTSRDIYVFIAIIAYVLASGPLCVYFKYKKYPKGVSVCQVLFKPVTVFARFSKYYRFYLVRCRAFMEYTKRARSSSSRGGNKSPTT